jgi:hypothetical protein
MDVGKPQREIYVEPLELPEPLRTNSPEEPERVTEPVESPEKEPVENGFFRTE